MSNASRTTEPGMSAEALYALTGEERYELVSGELRVSEPPGWSHGVIAARLASRLAVHAGTHRLGDVVVETGFVLRRNPDTVRGPDVAFVRAGRAPGAAGAHRFFEGAPDLAIEVVSPDDRAWEIGEKVEEYLVAGTRLVWAVDPRNRHVVVHTPDRIARLLRAGDALDGADVVPGFRLALDDLFAPA
jgi:Uma2 family endonuclease